MEGDIMAYDNIMHADDEQESYYELEDAISDTNHLWSLDKTTGTVPIPFKIDDGIGPDMRDMIFKAISEYDKKTCIRYSSMISHGI